MKKITLLSASVLLTPYGYACVSCNRQIQDGIFNSTFYPNLLAMLSAFIVLTIIVVILSRMATKRYEARMAADPNMKELPSVPLSAAAMVLGIGLGGFADGIILHQILQWHEMLTNKIAPDTIVNKSINMFWDGIFHAFCLVVTIVGIHLLWKLLQRQHINRSGYLLAGGILTGWGLFNLVEGIIDHHLLKLHNVLESAPNHDLWNYGFLAIGGIGFILIGWLITRQGTTNAPVQREVKADS